MAMTEAFGGLEDPRTGPARRHDLTEMILVALCAVLCGADTWEDIAEWAKGNQNGRRCANTGPTSPGSAMIHTQYPKRSLRSRRKTAERLPDYRTSLLGLIPQSEMRLPAEQITIRQ